MPDEGDDMMVKVGDFGLAKLFPHEGMLQATGTYVGTPGYAPPEILNHEMYSYNVDVWTLGVCTYIFLCGCPPFQQNMKASTVEAIKHADRELHFPESHFGHVSEVAKVRSPRHHAHDMPCASQWPSE
jgi:serine/threonine protein kinase